VARKPESRCDAEAEDQSPYASSSRETANSANSMSGQLQEARWLIKNVQQRFDTILRVPRRSA